MLRRLLQLLTLAAVVNLIYQYWPRSNEEDELIPVIGSMGKWGYVDSSGRVRIDFKWELAYPFGPDGTANVSSADKTKWGKIDKSGAEIVPVAWDEPIEFNEFGLSPIVNNGLVG